MRFIKAAGRIFSIASIAAGLALGQQSQSGQQSEQARKDGQPEARNPQPNQTGQEQADTRPEPGKMSREEARQLLDSLKSDDHKMPLEPYARGNASSRNDEPLKDW